jgi:hypothetical protein
MQFREFLGTAETKPADGPLALLFLVERSVLTLVLNGATLIRR